jgi:hypothetical protein
MSGTNIDSNKLNVVVRDLADKAAYRAAQRIALRARASVIGQGRYDTGEMMSGFKVKKVTKAPGRPTYKVYNTSAHFPYQELGTPKEAPGIGFIYPKKAQFLVFKPKGSNSFVFAKRVRGVKPGNFLRNAAAKTRAVDFLPGGALA